ncbi:MAG: biotin--[acetyl-CoA-carboxylase] ligase [Candidatus Dormibacteraeota bacterium]|nr:biotin--[acetyl-CoA-carboxylase] ligase [Candidatus Dormibacteraeota bacterium]
MVKRVFALHEVARTTSTQDVARNAARSGAAEGFCCLAAEQTAGRGRLGRSWVAPPGTAMLASVLLRTPEVAAPGVPFAAGLSLRDAVAETTGVEAQLKWPNDVLIGGRKLAGILVELCSGAPAGAGVAVIAGAGVNLTVREFPDGIDGVSLHAVTDTVPAPRALLEAWLRHLDARVTALELNGLPGLLGDWRRYAAGLGAAVSVRTPSGVIEGTAVDVRDDGALLIAGRAGVTPVLAGDVQLVQTYPHTVRMHQG